MDTSKEYIKMCEKAEEIQEMLDNSYYTIENVFAVRAKRKQCIHEEEKLFIPYSYDKVYCERCGKKLEEYETEYIATYSQKPFHLLNDEVQKFIWLPRQDQLQQMIAKFYLLPFNTFHKFCIKNQVEFNSMEQLWLTFVMWQKYHKIWNGEDWVEEKE